MDRFEVQLSTENDIITARRCGRDLAKRLGFGPADQTRLATVISELARNVVTHAVSGVCIVTDASDARAARVRVVVEDHGPGIPDVEQALTDGFSTGSGMGAGLPGAKRLVHKFEIFSVPGHTRITVEMVLGR